MTQTLSRILFVEDEPDIQSVARLALESVGGFTVEICSSGSEAVSKAAAFSPDLFLLDYMMPGMDGPTTLKALRGIPGLAEIPAIFMTAKVLPQEIAGLKELGAIEVIAKPFDSMRLSDQIKEAWEKRS